MDLDYDSQSEFTQKSKSQNKGKNKLTSKHRSRSQKQNMQARNEDADIFSPISCSLTRKSARVNKQTTITVLGADEDNIKSDNENQKLSMDSKNKQDDSVKVSSQSTCNSSVQESVSSEVSKKCSNKRRTSKQESENECVIVTNSDEDLKISCNAALEKQFCSKVINHSDNQNGDCIQLTDNLVLGASPQSAIRNYSSQLEQISKNVPIKSSENIPISNNSSACSTNEDSVPCKLSKKSVYDSSHSDNRKIVDMQSKNSPHKSYKKDNTSVLNVDNSSNTEEYKSRFFIEKGQDTVVNIETNTRNSSLEHLNDSTADFDSKSLLEGQKTSNQLKVESKKYETSAVPKDESKKLFSCPLCWKCFESPQNQTQHVKGCATQHNLTTRQLLDAMELQEKQTAERLALGLPDVPTVHVVKKPPSRRNTGGLSNDNNLQLALALSVSMQEAEEQEQLKKDECLIEAGLGHEVVARQKTMLERFGFTSSRPPIPSSNTRPKKGNKSKCTVSALTQRTKEERDRIVTEKVAIILIGDDSTGSSATDSKESYQAVDLPIGTVKNLQKYAKKTGSLWNAVTDVSCKEELQVHYVQELSHVISPAIVKAGEKLKHLSQVPGRNITPVKSTFPSPEEGFCPSTSFQAVEEAEDIPEKTETQQSLDHTPLASFSQNYEKNGFKTKVIKNSSKNPKARRSLTGLPKGAEASKNSLAETLINDWRSMLNKKAMSDVKVIVEYDKEISAHKLVFYARCKSILKDIVTEMDSNASTCMLIWVDISYQAALAFLQFIYSGLTSKIFHLDDKDISSVKKLAQRYRVTELLEHLKVVNRVRLRVNKNSSSSSSKLTRNSLPEECNDMTPEKGNLSYAKSSTDLQSESTSSASNNFDSIYHNLKQSLSHDHKFEQSSALSGEFSPAKHLPNAYPPLKNNSPSPLKYSGQKEKKIVGNSVPFNSEQNSSSLRHLEHRERSVSPDLFVEEENEDGSEESKLDIRYLLNIFDKVFTQSQETEIQKESSRRSVSISPSLKAQSSSPSHKHVPKLVTSPQKNLNESSSASFGNLSSMSQNSPQSKSQIPSLRVQNSLPSNKSLTKSNTSPRKDENKSASSVCENFSGVLQNSPQNKAQILFSGRKKDEYSDDMVQEESFHPSTFSGEASSSQNVTELIHNPLKYASVEQQKISAKSDFNHIDFLEHLLSDSSSDAKESHMSPNKTSKESKRRLSGSDLSLDWHNSSVKKVCRESLENKPNNISSNNLEPCVKDLEVDGKTEDNIVEFMDLTGNSNDSDQLEQHFSAMNKTSMEINTDREIEETQNVSISNKSTCDQVADTEDNDTDGNHTLERKSVEKEFTKEDHNSIKTTEHFQDEWDSFDEMCNAAEPEIFSQGLSKMISSQQNSSRSHRNKQSNSNSSSYFKHLSQNDNSENLLHKSPDDKALLEDSLLNHLNESILWREENAPSLKPSSKDRRTALIEEHNKYKTPSQQQKNRNADDVTPPANYSAMKTPELKKELRKFGLKPSLTKKQAKIMLRYIYDQLHPYITITDSDESGDDKDKDLQSPFKIPDKNTRVPRSPKKSVITGVSKKKVNNRKVSPVSVRRSLASQISTRSDDELSSSQESSSSSAVDIAEEMIFDDFEGVDTPLTQNECSEDALPSVMHNYLLRNPDLLQKVLLYEPIWLEELHEDLKAQNFKFKLNQLTDYIDEQCITFRTVQGQRNRERKKQKQERRKQKSPKKRKGKSAVQKSSENCPSSSSN